MIISHHFKRFNYFKYLTTIYNRRLYLLNNISYQINYERKYSNRSWSGKFLPKKRFLAPDCINYEKKTPQQLVSLLSFYFNTKQISKAFETLDQIENLDSFFELTTSYNIIISKSIENLYLIFDSHTKSLKLGNNVKSSNLAIKQTLLKIIEKSNSFQWNLYTYHAILKCYLNNDNIVRFIEDNIFIKNNCNPNIDTFQLLLQCSYNSSYNNIEKLINYMSQYNIIPETKINSQILKQLFVLNHKDSFNEFVIDFSSSQLSNLSAEVITLFLKENNDEMARKFFNKITTYSNFTHSISHYARFISYYAVHGKLLNVNEQLELLTNKNFDWKVNKFIISSLLAHPKQYNEVYEQAKYLININHLCVDTRLCDAFMKASNILNKPQDCINVYQKLINPNISNINMSHFSYGYIITAFLQQNNMEVVNSLIKEMKEKHFSLFSIYKTIIDYYVSNHDFDKANNKIKDILHEDIAPQHRATLYIPLLKEYYTMKQFSKVDETLNTMKKMNIIQNTASCYTRIHGICKYKEPNNQKLIEDIIIEMKSNNIKINDATINLIYIHYPNVINKFDICKETKSLNSSTISPSLKTVGLSNNTSTPNTSTQLQQTPIQTIYKNIDSSSSSVTEFISKLEKRALLSSYRDSYYVLKYFRKTKQYKKIVEMFWIYIYPNNMKDTKRIYPPCYYHLTTAHFNLKEYEKLDNIFSLMKQNNIILTSDDYSYKISSYIETGKLDTAISIFKQLQKNNNIKIIPIMYYYLIEGLIKHNRTPEAFDFLSEATNNSLNLSMLYDPFFESCSNNTKNDLLLSYYSKMRNNTKIIPTYKTYSIIYNILLNQYPLDTNTIINILKDQSLFEYFTISRYSNIIQKLLSFGCFNDDNEIDSLLSFINNELQKKNTKQLVFLNEIILQYSSRYFAERKLNNNEIKLFTYLFENIYPSIPTNKTMILKTNIESSLNEIKQLFYDILNTNEHQHKEY